MANTNDFFVELLAKLDTSSANADYAKLKKELASSPIVQKITLDTAMTKQAIKDISSEIHNELAKAFKNTGIENFDISVKEVEKILSKAIKEQQKLNTEQGKSVSNNKNVVSEQERYYKKLAKAIKELLAIDKQRITAGEKQLEILDKQNKRRDTRISYNEGQINKKGLTDTSIEREINDLRYAEGEKYDVAFAKEIDKNVSSLSKLKEKWQEQGVYVDEFKTKVESLESSLNNINSGDVSGLSSIKKQMEELKTEASQIAEVDKIKHSLSVGDYDVEVSSLTSKFQKWGLSVEEVDVKMKELNASYNNLKNAKTDDQRIQAEKEYQLALEKTNNELKLMNLNSASRADRTNLSNKIQVWLDKNTKASNKARKELQDYIVTLNSADEMGVPALQKIKNEFTQIEIAERSAGRLGKSFIDTLKAGAQKFAEWGLASNAVMAVWNKSKEMVDAVYEIDTAMTELYKVTDETAERYDKFLDSASKKAKELGATVTDIISSTADFSKLGYSLDEASVLAEIATIYKNVGDIDIESATESIVSTMAAYGYTAEEAIQIIDKFNQVGNNFSISSADIGEALQRSASSLASSGNTLDESIALITAGKLFCLKYMETYIYRTHLTALIA